VLKQRRYYTFSALKLATNIAGLAVAKVTDVIDTTNLKDVTPDAAILVITAVKARRPIIAFAWSVVVAACLESLMKLY
jgi:hypothetical protein